ncbi:ABC transporter permease subunit, partial [Streptomyces sp. 2MCAF27]
PAQREAAIALSFTPAQRMRRVILPQAIPEMIPPFNNLLIELLKATALVSAVSVADITFAAQLSRLATGDSLEIYSIILVLYFVLAFVLTRLMRLLERRAKAGIGQAPERRRKGLLVTRKLSAAQETEQSANLTTVGGAQ